MVTSGGLNCMENLNQENGQIGIMDTLASARIYSLMLTKFQGLSLAIGKFTCGFIIDE